jgi:predicted dehydrogenase
MLHKPIKWGILGTSYISEVMAKAIQESDTGELVAIASRSLLTAKSFSEKFLIQKIYDDYHALINDKEINAVYIGLPNHLHKEWTINCANAGKHILCEKPFVISINEAHEVISIVNKSNVFCMEALMYRCHPFTKKLQELVKNKIIGDIKLYVATYTANIADIANPTAGGSIRNLGCYPISLVRLLAQAEPIEMVATGRLSQKNNTDNQASVILKFADHSMAVVSTADDIEMFWQFDIYGSDGCLKVITNPWLPTCDNNKILISQGKNNTPSEINVTAEKSLYTYQIDVLGKSIINRNKTKCDGISLLDSMGNTVVLETWLQQIKKNRSNEESSETNNCFMAL